MLSELDLQSDYDRDSCPDLLGEFFEPVLANSVSYDRTTFTFNAGALSVAAAGLAGFIRNGGRMRLICHHEMDRDVLQAILDGQCTAEDAVLDSIAPGALTDVKPENLAQKHHLELLTWLVRENRAEIRVAISNDASLFHRKTGIFTDSNGDSLAFIGSINETMAAWIRNDEEMMVITSWWGDRDRSRLEGKVRAFERLWNGTADSSIVIPIPEALRQDLIVFAPKANPAPRHPIHAGQPADPPGLPREELWASIRHAIAHDPQSTLETIAAELWPHQLSFWRRYARDADELPRVLIADEVGLGKTIQAGALLKTFMNRGQADRILVLTPPKVRRQWQEELAQKFNIHMPILDRRGSSLHLVDGSGDSKECGPLPWREAPQLILSYAWLRRNSEAFFADEHPEYDIIVFDEAHRARYTDVNNPRRRRPNSYLRLLRQLSEDTQGLLLLTATPMQIDPAELWGLLQVLAVEDQWCEDEFRRFYDTSREHTLVEWEWYRRLWTRNGLPGSLDQIAELSRMSPEEVRTHLRYIEAGNPVTLARIMTPERIAESMTMMRRSSAIKRSVSRHTRVLLRQYAEEGKLTQTVPEREVEEVVIEMTDWERSIYDDIRGFVNDWYRDQTDVGRQALGFVMTHFRMRFASSRYAFLKSLQYAKVRRQSVVQWDDLFDEDEDDFEFDPEAELPDIRLTSRSEDKLNDLIDRCQVGLDNDSKFREFLNQLERLRRDGHTRVMVFSQFWDTQEWLREKLKGHLESYTLAGLSGNEDWVYDPAAGIIPETRDRVTKRVREAANSILLCTETAAESLNYQFFSAIINYDIPWNPMQLEQRIGRIDRIGQERSKVRIIHLFYKDTTEYDAYQAMARRIASFTENVGVLQPILAANLEKIIRDSDMSDDPSESVREAVASLPPAGGFDLDDLAAAAADTDDPEPMLHLNDLTYVLGNPGWLPDNYETEPRGNDHWRVETPDHDSVVTTSRTAHDYAAGSVEFFGPGSRTFPQLDRMGLETTISDEPAALSIKDIILRSSSSSAANDRQGPVTYEN